LFGKELRRRRRQNCWGALRTVRRMPTALVLLFLALLSSLIMGYPGRL
jgi:hypothetical protein